MNKAQSPRSQMLIIAIVLCASLLSCGSYGPRSMDRDHLDYGRAIGDNWKNQMLVNIVKLRFIDMPVFVDVGSIVSGYTFSTTVNGRLGFGDSFTAGNSQSLGASGTYTDRPTITYMPKTGDEYLRAILQPIKPAKLLALIQAGYSAELLLSWGVEAINGVRNYSTKAIRTSVADPEFQEFTRLMEELQVLGAVGFELDTDPDTKHEVIFVLNKEGLPESTLQKSRRAAEIIGLEEGRDRYNVLYAPFKTSSDSLSIQTRSVIQMLSVMAAFVDVPAEYANHATPGFDMARVSSRPFHVKSGLERPDNSFATVKYNGYWYWIENSDMASKRVFTLMLFMTTLTNQAKSAALPVLTIPTQ